MSTCPSVPGSSSSFSSQAHLTASAPFRAGPPGPVSGRLSAGHQLEGLANQSRFPAAFRPPAFASRSSDSAEELGPPHGRLTGPNGRTSTGLPRSARTSSDRGGCPLYPGDGGAHPGPGTVPGRRPPHHSGNVPAPRLRHSTWQGSRHEASTKVQAIHPSGLPLARGRPDGTSSRFGFPPSFAPRRPRARRRTSGWGQAN